MKRMWIMLGLAAGFLVLTGAICDLGITPIGTPSTGITVPRGGGTFSPGTSVSTIGGGMNINTDLPPLGGMFGFGY